MIRFICLLFYFYTVSVFAAGLSPIEQKIRDVVLSQKEAQISLLEKWVNMNSGTTHVAGVKAVGEKVRPYFEQLGFTTQWVEEPAAMQRAGTLIAKHRGSQGKRLLLIAHLDTVFPKNSRFQQFVRQKTMAKGPGTLDDKGGIVVMLFALQALHAVHALDNTDITVILTGDEEESGKPTRISRKPLKDAAVGVDAALDFESSISLNTATIARRGISNWTTEVHGNESHSATIFQKDVGAGAIFELARMLNTMRTDMVGMNAVTFNPGIMLGGTELTYAAKKAEGSAFGRQNVVAKTALASGDIRYLTKVQKETIKQKMRRIASLHLPGTKSSITFQDGIPAMPPTANNLALLKLYSEASAALGLGTVTPLDPGIRGAGDISYVADTVPANLAGLGPIGIGAHSVIEAVELNSLPIQTERAAIFMYRLTR